jgi:hypothetical protein
MVVIGDVVIGDDGFATLGVPPGNAIDTGTAIANVVATKCIRTFA